MILNRYELQLFLEKKYLKNQKTKVLNEYFITKKSVMEKLLHHNIYVNFGLEVLTYLLEKEYSNISELLGKTVKYFNKDGSACANELYKLAEIDLIDYNEELQIFYSKYTLPNKTKQNMEKWRFPLPTLIKPKKPENNRSKTYLTHDFSCLFGNKHHEGNICLEHLDLCNNISYSLNISVISQIKNDWNNINIKKKNESYNEFNKRKRAFNKYNKDSKECIDILIKGGNSFYFDHGDDARGRTYCRGYHLNTQGNDWNKACLEFTEKEIIND